MEKKELIERLENIKKEYWWDTEEAHVEADSALIEYINDEEVTKAYDNIDKWYA